MADQTSIFGLHLWIVLGVTAGAVFVLFLFLLSLWFTKSRSKPQISIPTNPPQIIPGPNSIHRLSAIEKQALLLKQEEDYAYPRIQIEMGKGHRVLYPGVSTSAGDDPTTVTGAVGPEVSLLGWGHWYTLRELEADTNGFAAENVIGEGGYG